MVHGHTLRILLQGLTLSLSLLGPLCKAASLGLSVAVVPLESDGGRTVGDLHTNTHTTATFIHPALQVSLSACLFTYLFHPLSYF